jgi:hypothetical protein
MEICDRSDKLIPRIFVGTMYSGESEFDDCKRKIREQEDVLIDHLVIQGMLEFDAHNLLWNEWNKAKINYDLFIKVDADTLVDDPTMFSKIWAEFRKNSRLTGIQIPLHDYFTDSLIAGLNCFSPAVVFKPSTSRLHADHADSNHDHTMKGDSVIHLSPAGRHCASPSRRQSFHYGLHRMKKGQRETIRKVVNSWKQKGGEGRLFAMHGAAAALSHPIDHDYNTESFESEFNRIESIFDREDEIRSLLLRLE